MQAYWSIHLEDPLLTRNPRAKIQSVEHVPVLVRSTCVSDCARVIHAIGFHCEVPGLVMCTRWSWGCFPWIADENFRHSRDEKGGLSDTKVRKEGTDFPFHVV